MTNYIAITDGPFSTITTWGTITNAVTLHATTNITVNATSYTAKFTAPNITNACVGVLMFVTTTPDYDYTVTLQENEIDTAAAVTVSGINFPVASNWIFFKFTVPYVFTATTVNFYRFKIVQSGAGTINLKVAADSGGTLICFQAIDDRASVPVTAQNIYIVGANGTGTVTVIMDGTQSVGVGTDTVLPVQRTIGNAITISGGGLLNWDITASATLTCKGNFIISDGGELRIGTVAVPYPAARLANIIFNENGTTVNHGMRPFGTAKITLQGAPKSSVSLWKTKYVSGAGTAVDPMIVIGSVAWSVNDEIIVGADSDNATNYNESENKFIKTVVSPTTYVLSDTKGGAESALSYTHTSDAWVLNIERNILINTSNTAQAWYFYKGITTPGNINFDWCRFETLGGNAANKAGFYLGVVAGSVNEVDYCVAYRALQNGFAMSTTKEVHSFTGLIACNSNQSVSNMGSMSIGGTNSFFTDCFAVKCSKVGFLLSAAGNTFTRCCAISCGIATTGHGMYLSGCFGHTFIDCESHCNRGNGLFFVGNSVQILFTGFLCGTKGLNATDITVPADSFNQLIFIEGSFGNTPYLNGYLDLVLGSYVQFGTLNGTLNNHIWYTNAGSAQSTGALLADTVVRTPGSLGVRLTPESSTAGFVWDFNIYCKSNSIINFFGYFKKNAAFGADVARVELWLPDSIVADDTFTLANDTTWQACSLSKEYTGTTDKLATIKIIGVTATPGAYLYCDDFYNAGDTVISHDKVTGLDTWTDGKVVDIISPQQVSAADIWTFSTNDLNTVDTTGKALNDICFAETGRWLRDGTQLKIYKKDNVTLMATFDLKKADGTAAGESDDVFERVVV